MNELVKYKNRILVSLVSLLVIVLVGIVMVLGAAPVLDGSVYVYVLIFLLLVCIPLIASLGMTGIKVINSVLFNEQKMSVLDDTELEKMDKAVEEKVKEADEISFNLKMLKESLPDYTDWETFGQALLTGVSKQLEIVIGIVYKFDKEDYNPVATYGYFSDSKPTSFKEGEGISGQVVKDKKAIFLSDVPENYVKVVSGLGTKRPEHLSFIPLISKGAAIGVVELATFTAVSKGIQRRVEEIAEFMGDLAPEI